MSDSEEDSDFATSPEELMKLRQQRIAELKQQPQVPTISPAIFQQRKQQIINNAVEPTFNEYINAANKYNDMELESIGNDSKIFAHEPDGRF